jgi:uncharacterized protein YjaZ
MKNLILISVVLMIVSFLDGCVQEKATETTKQTKTEDNSKESNKMKSYEIKNAFPVQFTVAGQAFEIVPVLEPHLEYVKKVKENEESNHKELYLSTVIEPFQEEELGEKRVSWLSDYLPAPINIEKLNESIILLDENFEHITSLIKESLEKSAALLPGGNKTVYLFPFNPDHSTGISRMSGVAGLAAPEQFILLQIAPQKYKEERIPYTISHEYHHTIYYEKIITQKRDLLDYVLVEGKADAFANLVYPNTDIPWKAELPTDVVQTIWNWANERRFSFTKSDVSEMRTGNRVIPEWTDYKLSYHIMQDFLERLC